MRKLITALLCLHALCSSALAMPPEGMVYDLKASVVKVRVALPNGHSGVGSGVVVAKDQVVTNCHVIAHAQAINVIKFGESHRANYIKADWHHDLCIVGFDGLNTKIAELGSGTSLQYEQPVFTISFPNNSPRPLTTYGLVKALYPMDDAMIIQTTNDFRMGASGGAMFNDDGKLVGIITLKSPGRKAFYYNLPAEWITSLLLQPELSIPAAGTLPFWDAPEQNRPYFMRVIQPLQTEDWPNLKIIAQQWLQQEPNTLEALHYLAIAEYRLNDLENARLHLNQVYTRNNRHADALFYLGLIAAQMGNKEFAAHATSLLETLNKDVASQLHASTNSANLNCNLTPC
ncbi:MAG: serine protease [Betaproteobacteria bacterium HGW-Betaproteobacteria-22]|nr:MAG: serine protease [Betaproteobacteria bacterium HGW-Betaproteobacteria-22]